MLHPLQRHHCQHRLTGCWLELHDEFPCVRRQVVALHLQHAQGYVHGSLVSWDGLRPGQAMEIELFWIMEDMEVEDEKKMKTLQGNWISCWKFSIWHSKTQFPGKCPSHSMIQCHLYVKVIVPSLNAPKLT